MAYGKPHVKPRTQMKKLGEAGTSGQKQAKTIHTQQGKTGLEGASEHSKPDWGGLPSSGPVKANARSVDSNVHGGSTTGAGSVKKTDENPQAHVVHNQAAGKKPLDPQSSGGPQLGSIDTLTNLIFHPKGGLGNKAAATRKSPKGDGKFKDSGMKGPNQVTGVNNAETY